MVQSCSRAEHVCSEGRCATGWRSSAGRRAPILAAAEREGLSSILATNPRCKRPGARVRGSATGCATLGACRGFWQGRAAAPAPGRERGGGAGSGGRGSAVPTARGLCSASQGEGEQLVKGAGSSLGALGSRRCSVPAAPRHPAMNEAVIHRGVTAAHGGRSSPSRSQRGALQPGRSPAGPGGRRGVGTAPRELSPTEGPSRPRWPCAVGLWGCEAPAGRINERINH